MTNQKLTDRNIKNVSNTSDLIHIVSGNKSYNQTMAIAVDNKVAGIAAGYRGSLAIADTPTEDGYYYASESGTYVNAGGLVVSLSDQITIISVIGTQTVFTKIEIPITTLGYNVVSNISEFTASLSSGVDKTWLITEEIDLSSSTVTLPANVVLMFNNNGRISNGTINFDNTSIPYTYLHILNNITKGTGDVHFEKAIPENFGALGDDTTDDTTAFQDAIDLLGENGTLYLQAKRYLITSLTINFYFSIIGVNVKLNRFACALRSEQTTGVMITCNHSLFQCTGVDFIGSSDDANRGSDTTLSCFKFTGNLNGANVDAQFSTCGFIYFNKIIELEGRNLMINDCVLVGCYYGVYVGATGIVDMRGVEAYDCRYHSMGNISSTGAVFYFNPVSNFSDVLINGYADDCGSAFYKGFSGETIINNVLCTKLDNKFIDIDTTGLGLTYVRRNLTVKNCIVDIFNGALTNDSLIKILGGGTSAKINIENNILIRSGGHGIEVDMFGVQIIGNTLHDCGAFADLTYYPIYLSAAADYCVVKNNILKENVGVATTNDAKAGIYIGGFNCNLKGNYIKGFSGKEVEYGVGTIAIFGEIPREQEPCFFYASSVPPRIGYHNVGDITINTVPTAGGNVGWVCITAGTSGTWKTYGTIEA